ncbi:MAG: hypothetical protein RL341_397 [Pseudomonadota bacterium]|jgi:hypothetical protein
MKQLQLKPLAIGLALALGAHCGAMAATEQPKPASANKAKPTKGWITAPSKKGGSGVVVRYRIDGTPAVGKPLPITLSLSGVNSEEGAQVSLGTEGTGLAMDKQRATSQKLASYQATTMPMSVTPQAEGTFYLTVVTEQNGRSSVTMIPVRVGHGKVALKPMGEVVTTPEGEKIISMPAK